MALHILSVLVFHAMHSIVAAARQWEHHHEQYFSLLQTGASPRASNQLAPKSMTPTAEEDEAAWEYQKGSLESNMLLEPSTFAGKLLGAVGNAIEEDSEQRDSETDLWVDISYKAFPREWYQWNHSGYPRSHQGTPSFPDFNNDGLLDFLYHNHYEAEPSTSWDMGVALPHTDFTEGPYYESVSAGKLVLTEASDSKYKRSEPAMDTHGTAVLDIDRDGVLDIYMASGGGNGVVSGPCKNAVLLWGERVPGENVPLFRGGRDAAELANLHNPDTRGRMNYFLDINGDGLLDVIYLTEPRVDDLNAPGFAMINQGNRTFAEHRQLTEYISTMILHDADGDGRAEEVVVQRRDCAYKECSYRGDKRCLKMKWQESTKSWHQFCRSRPEGSTAVYKFDYDKQELAMITPPVVTDLIGADKHAESMQSGDFDGDGKADLAVLMPDSVDFYLSSKRDPGKLPEFGNPHEQVTWNRDSCHGMALRIADLDLDGRLEVLVLCFLIGEEGPNHRLYARRHSNTWELQTGRWLGALVDTGKVHPEEDQVRALCGDGVSHKGYLHKICEERQHPEEGGHLGTPRSMGMSIVDWNNDGYLDLIVSYDIGRMLMMKNNFKKVNSGNNKFLAIKLIGTQSNQYGIGATVLLTCSNMGTGTEKTVQLREVYSASHEVDWSGTRDDRLIFGLGQNGIPEKVVVRWPGRYPKTQIIDNKDLLHAHITSMASILTITEAS